MGSAFGRITAATIYSMIPAPANSDTPAQISRMMFESMPKYSPIPPHTPQILQSVADRLNSFFIPITPLFFGLQLVFEHAIPNSWPAVSTWIITLRNQFFPAEAGIQTIAFFHLVHTAAGGIMKLPCVRVAHICVSFARIIFCRCICSIR